MKVILIFLVSFLLCILFAVALMPLLRRLKQPILHYVKEHSAKAGTPTMGGVIFLISIALSFISCTEGYNKSAVLALCITIGYAVIGFLDDFLKLRYKENMGLRPWQKALFQLGIAVISAFFVYYGDTELILPFSGKSVNLGWWIIPLTVVVFLAVTNGVNLTDGLDGLCSWVVFVYSVLFCVILLFRGAYFDEAGRIAISGDYLNMAYLCAAVAGSLFAFLLFNVNPAKIFMGDTGSLLLGGFAASVGCFSEFSLFIPFFGIVFVISCVSVILQVAHFKRTGGKRIFLMAPYHHHLQMKGLSETRISQIYVALTVFVSLCVLLFTFFL